MIYSIDKLDTVSQLAGVPQPDVNAPSPLVIAGDLRLILAYSLQIEPEVEQMLQEHMLRPTVAEPTRPAVDRIAVAMFDLPYAHMFGPPNVDVLSAHPLYGRGLDHYSVAEVRNSSWIRQSERMNRVHPSHCAEFFRALRHFVLTFHDSTFECLAREIAVETSDASISEIVARFAAQIR